MNRPPKSHTLTSEYLPRRTINPMALAPSPLSKTPTKPPKFESRNLLVSQCRRSLGRDQGPWRRCVALAPSIARPLIPVHPSEHHHARRPSPSPTSQYFLPLCHFPKTRSQTLKSDRFFSNPPLNSNNSRCLLPPTFFYPPRSLSYAAFSTRRPWAPFKHPRPCSLPYFAPAAFVSFIVLHHLILLFLTACRVRLRLLPVPSSTFPFVQNQSIKVCDASPLECD